MRNPLSRLIWLLLFSSSAAIAAGRGLEPEATPDLPYAPAHFRWLKSSWLQDLAERFSNDVDVLALQLSAHLGGWSRQPLLFAITPSKVLVVLVILALGVGIGALARVLIVKKDVIAELEKGSSRFWRQAILFAFCRALSGFFIFTGAFFAAVPILPHIGLALGGFPTFAIAAKIAQVGYFATGVGFCLRIARFVERWLNSFVQSSSIHWYYGAFPVLGQALFYNLVLCAVSAAIYILDLPEPIGNAAYRSVSIASIVVNTVLLIRAVLAVEAMVGNRSEILQYDEYKKRRVQTRVQMLRRLVVFFVLVGAVAAILLNFQEVRQIGTGLLASAGLAGVIAGFAAQKSLSTVIAGLQIAITQPMRIDDVVIVEGEWGTIEEITLTYAVVRVWDQRRLIVPITNFLEKSFQNWTRNSSDLIGTVFFYADFQIPIDELRAESRRVVEASSLWDKRVFVLQVTDFKPDSVEIRILASAATAMELFDLRCEIREKILRFLQQQYPQSFPRVRTTFSRAALQQ